MNRQLLKLSEGVPYIPGPDEFVITEQHSLEDILVHLLTEAGPNGKNHLIEIIHSISIPFPVVNHDFTC